MNRPPLPTAPRVNKGSAAVRAASCHFVRIMPLAMTVLLAVGGITACGETLAGCTEGQVELFLRLARLCEQSYDDSLTGLEQTPSGCVALIREDGEGNLVIAFRGSMLGDRAPKHRFSNLGGANVRRNYRDWVATNLKQTAGFLPRQYVEAAALAERHVAAHRQDRRVYITGHSKGGGAATYAFVAIALSPRLTPRQKGRVEAVTFNAAVVREQNWRRLFREASGDAGEPAAGTVAALVMRDDPVSKIAASEERKYVRRIGIVPTAALGAGEQHGIGAVIDELEKILIVKNE